MIPSNIDKYDHSVNTANTIHILYSSQIRWQQSWITICQEVNNDKTYVPEDLFSHYRVNA